MGAPEMKGSNDAEGLWGDVVGDWRLILAIIFIILCLVFDSLLYFSLNYF